MPKKSLKNILKNCNKFIVDNSEVLDVIIFGSFVKGKDKPTDIDFLLIFKDKINFAVSSKLRKLFDKSEVTSKTYKEVFEITFLPRESILSDSISCVTGKKLSESYGYDSFVLFSYNLKNFSKTKRIQFFYALNGRKSEGMIKKLNACRLSNTILIVPTENSIEMRDFLNVWNVSFFESEILLPEKKLKLLIKK